MKIDGQHYRTIWEHPDNERIIQIIDQRPLPHRFVIEDLTSVERMATAIREMHLRGAGLIGAAAGYGMYLATLAIYETNDDDFMDALYPKAQLLKETRPTAVNLGYAVDRQWDAINSVRGREAKLKVALQTARDIADEDAEACRNIGEHAMSLIQAISAQKNGEPVNILTHCNAGWLAFVDYGSATAPIYAAHDANIPVHVYVDETRPRNQGARLTAWELGQHGVPHTIVADNVGGHLMQHGQVDLVITGADRVTVTGDVANKIGTYLKALAANDNDVPFYVALPRSTFDWHMRDGVNEIPIETRGEDEVHIMSGVTAEGNVESVRITPVNSPAINYGFDVTPSRLVTGLMTERGVIDAKEDAIRGLFPEE